MGIFPTELMEEVNGIINRVKKGDEAAFAGLCEKYEALIASSSERYFEMSGAESGASPDDFRQEATLALYRAAKTYDTEQDGVTFGLYAKTCIRNALVSMLRKTAKKPKITKTSHETKSAADPLGGLLSRESFSEMKEKLASIFSGYEYRVFLLYAEGKTPAQIASELKTSAKSVSNALFRAREKMKASFRRE